MNCLLKSDQESRTIFDTASYKVTLTGSSVTFLEGTAFIINGLKESIMWAFLLIALCMLYLFRSLRILLCSLVPNIIPLMITAGVMGWVGVRIKPSTVLVFSVALGIAIDITIRFLVNYKQELKGGKDGQQVVIDTIHKTGISIIYTSLVLIAGFVIFCFSGFGGTQALGWLTSLTLVMATFTNLVFLPALLLSTGKEERSLTLLSSSCNVFMRSLPRSDSAITNSFGIHQYIERNSLEAVHINGFAVPECEVADLCPV